MYIKKSLSRARLPVGHPLKISLASTILILANLLAWQLPGVTQTTINQPPNSQTASTIPVEHAITSPADVLLVELKEGADRQQFDDLLEETHVIYIRTISAGPTLKFLVVQTEPGKVAQVEQKLRKDNNVGLVERNRQFSVRGTATESALLKQRIIFDRHRNFFAPHQHNIGSHRQSNSAPVPPAPSQLSDFPDDPLLGFQYNLLFTNFLDARLLPGLNTRAVANFYILDSGIATNNDSPAVINQYDFSTDNSIGNRVPPHDSGVHGTAVASVTAWTDNNFGLIGTVNLEGQRCALTMCQITNESSPNTTLVRIVGALSFIASTPGLPPGPINLSYGNNPGDPSLNSNSAIQAVAKQLILKNFLVVLGAGNTGEQDTSPELYCRRVASVDPNGNLSSFSEHGPGIYAASYGENIPVYLTDGNVGFETGTSFSAPQWSAAIAVLMAAKPIINASQADSIITQTGFRTPQGFVVPNLKAALNALGY